MAESSDDEDDAPMTDAPPEPEVIDMELCIALRLVYGAGPRWVFFKGTTMITSHRLSVVPRVRCLVCPAQVPWQWQNGPFYYLRSPQQVLTQGDFCAVHCTVFGGDSWCFKLSPPFSPRGPRSPTRVQVFVRAWIRARRQPTAIWRVSAKRRRMLGYVLDGNRPRSWESAQVFAWMLGYVLHGQPTVILRVSTVRSQCLDMSSSGNRPWSSESAPLKK